MFAYFYVCVMDHIHKWWPHLKHWDRVHGSEKDCESEHKEKTRKEGPGIYSSQSETLERLTKAIAFLATRSDLSVFPHKPRFHSLGLIPFCVPSVSYEYGVCC